MVHIARRHLLPPRRSRPAVDALEARIAPAGNILVVTDGASNAQVLREFTPSGVKLRELTIDTAGTARDLAVSDDGSIHDLFGDLGTSLRTYSAATGTWTSHSVAGLSTINNVSYGGAAYRDGAVYVTDMMISGDSTQGVVRFNLSDWSVQRFATNLSPIDLNVGLDGKLYVLSSNGLVSVFDPTTQAQLGSLTLPSSINGVYQDYRAVAADADGNLYLATWSSQIEKFDPAGNLVASLSLSNQGFPTYGLSDIDLAADGTVIASSWGGSVFETTTTLAGLTGAFSVGGSGHTFVTFAGAAASPPPPVPGVTIADSAVVEGNSGTTTMSFTVSLSNISTSPVTVDWSTADGTATGSDYSAASGTLTFNPGETSKVVNVGVFGDQIDEHNETFSVNLSNPVNATIARGTALGTIADDDPAPIAKVLTASASGVLDDYTNSGTFTSQTSGANGLSVRKFDSTGGYPGIPYDERSVLEFATQPLPAQDVAGATLQVTVSSTTTPQTTYVSIYGFADDGNVTLDDGSRSAVLLGSFVPTSLTTYTIPLNLAGVLSLLNQGATHIGLRLQGIPNDNVQFYGTSSTSSAPKLTFQVEPPKISVDDVTVNEGDYAYFHLTLSQPLTTSATVGYSTAAVAGAPNPATQDVDYLYTRGTVTFAPGETSKTVAVATIGDNVADSGETFALVITSVPTPVAYGDATGVATIVDVPNPKPGIRVSTGPTVTEGGPGTTATAAFTVTLSVASVNPVTVDYATADYGSCQAGTDYQGASGTLTFAPGETSKTINVTVYGDNVYEGNESFNLNLSNPVNGTMLAPSATATIVDDDLPNISVADASVTEGNSGSTNASFLVTLSNPSAYSTYVGWRTVDGTAVAGSDYQSWSNTLIIPAGQTSGTITVPVYGDTYTEGNETFSVSLTSATYGTLVKSIGTATIVDDDPTSGTMSFGASSWGYAEDTNGDGTLDVLYSGGSSTNVRKVTSSPAVEDRSIDEFDVSRVAAGVVSSVTFDFFISSYVSNGGPVNIGGFAGTGTVVLADASRPVSPLGSYQPNTLGRVSVTLDRSAVLALAGSSRYLGLRLDPATSYVNTSLYSPSLGPPYAPGVTFHADLPVAFDDAYAASENAPLNIAAAGVLANDFAPAGTSLTAAVDQSPAHGTLTLAADGSFSYVPAADFYGTDSFSYHATAGTNVSNSATVTLTVGHVNQPPVAGNDAYSTDEDTALTVAAPGVLGNDTDPDGDPLSAVLVAGPTRGSLTLNADGSFTYSPNANANGPDSFTYKALDTSGAASNVATVSLVVNPVNDAPVAVNDAFGLNENNAIGVSRPGVLGNDSDVDGDPLSAVLVSPTSHGALTLNANGSFNYTPAANYYGPDSFTYQASDGSLLSAPATVSFTVSRINQPPIANPDTISVAENYSIAVSARGVLGNDTDPNYEPLTAALVTGVAHGRLTLGSDGSYSYTPAPNYYGTDSFTYTANDLLSASAPATVTINITHINLPPTAADDSYSVNENSSIGVGNPGVLINDSDPNGEPLTAVLVATPAHGSVSFNADGSFTYVPETNVYGADRFTYEATNGTLASNVATVFLTVAHVNQPPVASDGSVTTDENTAAAVTLVASDPDNDPLTYQVAAGPLHGTLSGTAPNLTYTPAANYYGTDGFTFTAGDGSLTSNTATVTINVNHVNQPPVAANNAYSTDENTALTVAAPGVLGNDTDPDGNALSAVLVAGPTHGGLTLNANGSFTYTPATNYYGSDQFTYQASDGALTSNIATVTLTVNHVNQPPVAANDAYRAVRNVKLTVAAPGVLGNDTDPDGNALSAVLVSGVSHGTLTLSANGSFTYTPRKNFTGTDQFTYKASDGSLSSKVATVTLTVSSSGITAKSLLSAQPAPTASTGRPTHLAATDVALTELARGASPTLSRQPSSPSAWSKAEPGRIGPIWIAPDLSLLETFAAGRRSRKNLTP